MTLITPSNIIYESRVVLKSHATANNIDGAWWPHSSQLESEIRDLIETVSERINPVVCVVFHENDWVHSLSRIQVDNHLIWLDGYRYWPSGVVKLRGINDKQGLTIMVIPPDTSAPAAATILAAASSVRDNSTVGELTELASVRQVAPK
ncbi:DUF5994 family protein [Gordonia sp. CPCC 205333]|uniref:DUF5994 family protein n=1 Tax=Gordonia sp. CPCC 205333 TaxID=3140790 RepID=UPI003AF3C33A